MIDHVIQASLITFSDAQLSVHAYTITYLWIFHERNRISDMW